MGPDRNRRRNRHPLPVGLRGLRPVRADFHRAGLWRIRPDYPGRSAAFPAARGGGRRRAVHLRRIRHAPAVAGAATGPAAAAGLRAGAGCGSAGVGRVPQLALVHPAGLGWVADSLRLLATGTGTFHWIGAGWHYRHIPGLRRSHHCLPHRAAAGGGHRRPRSGDAERRRVLRHQLLR